MPNACFLAPEQAFELSQGALETPGPPRLMVLVAVEEPFDWDKLHAAGRHPPMSLGRFEELARGLVELGLKPTYALDYVAAQAEGDLFARLRERGECVLGAHLHPWVNPPFDSQEDEAGFAANLPSGLELEKLASLTALIQQRCGAPASVYQAGRYGIGPSTPAHLQALGLCVDASVMPGFDYSPEGGPDFSRFDSRPRVFKHAQVLSVPITGGFLGLLAKHGPRLGLRFQSAHATRLKLTAGFDRMRLFGRMRLSPEGHDLKDLKRLTGSLFARGERVFTLYLHSSSLVAGATSYARGVEGVEQVLKTCFDFVRWFLGPFNGQVWDHERLAMELLPTASRNAQRRSGP